MRVLLDECLPRRLKYALSDHEVVTVPDAGWAGKQNGELLTLAQGQYDVFVTIDQNLPAQQAIGPSTPSVFVLCANSNRYDDIRPLIPDIVKALQTIGPGKLVRIGTSR